MSQIEEPQFDRVEFDRATPSECASCNRPLAGFYYEANGATVCEACRYELEARLTGGSGMGRAGRAIGAGLGAALLGAVLYYAISALTGYEFGLIAIVVGYGVGAAVRWGSNGRGGWKYQTLAMALTYFAIVSTYIPPILKMIHEAQAAQTAGAATSQNGAGSGTAEEATTDAEEASPSTAEGPAPVEAEGVAAQPAALSADATTPQAATSTGAAGAVVGLLLLLAIASVAPFLAGIQNIIGLVIIGIGLFEAWKLNKRVELTITGPHTIANVAAV